MCTQGEALEPPLQKIRNLKRKKGNKRQNYKDKLRIKDT